MKVLMTTDTVGGVWTYTMELCAALGEFGVNVELASMGRALSPEQAGEVGALPHVHVHESDYRLCWMHEPWQDVERAGHWLLDLERQLTPDLVQLNDLGHGGLAWRSPVMLVGHSCVFSWWAAVKKQLPAPGDWRRYRSVVSASVQRADSLVAPSRAMLKSLLHFYGPARNAQVIANGRSYPPLARAAGPSGRQTGEGPAENTGPIIFAAGRIWDEAKNIATLVQVADALPWPVYVAGEEAEPGIRAAAARRQKKGANYLGFLRKEEMADWLRRSAIFVAPAYYEPFGLGILEAARAGCALVLGDIPSLREVWAEAAEYVNPDDPEQLQQTVSRLARNPGHRQYLAERAWQRAQAYSSQQMASDYMQLYRTLTHSPGLASRKRNMAGAKT